MGDKAAEETPWRLAHDSRGSIDGRSRIRLPFSLRAYDDGGWVIRLPEGVAAAARADSLADAEMAADAWVDATLNGQTRGRAALEDLCRR